MQRSRHLAFALAVAIVLVVAASGSVPVFASTTSHETARPVASPIQARSIVSSVAHPNKEVFGFALASSLADPSVGYPSWNFDLLSTVAFFGLHVDTAGQFVGDAGWNTWNSSDLTNLVALAHQHGTKVVLGIVLQDFSPNTPNMCAGLQHADATVSEAVREVQAKAVDGVNIDYEGLDGSCGTSDPYWAQHAMTSFAQKMRAGLGSSYYLSVDTYAAAASDGYGFFDVAGLAPYVDSFFVMAYDLEYSNYSRLPVSCPIFCLGPTAPLTAYYYNDTTIASQYVSVVGAAKVILGVPYYGRKSCVGAAVANAFPTSAVVADSYLDASTEATDPAVQAGSFSAHRETRSAGMERWDTWYNTTLGCTRELYWDDAVSLGKKYDLVNADGLRGVGIWNLNYGGGAPELWAALQSHFAACRSVAVTVNPAAPVAPGTQVQFAATTSGCPQPLYQFWILAPGSSSWSIARAYSSSATFTWNTSALASGTYLYSVWARDASGTASYDAYFPGTAYTLSSPCKSVTASAAPASPSISATSVTITGVASACPHPLYQFWILAPGGSWKIEQAYSTSAAFNWGTRGLPAGTYLYSVWARDAGSAASYDVYLPGTAYVLTTPCTSVTGSASPASTAKAATTVSITGVASGCPYPLYQFWILAPGGSWKVAQAYSTSATFSWSTSGLPAGTYMYSIWARDASSAAPYDAYFPGAAYALTTPCASVTASTSPASSAKAGTTVTITGVASGCPHPLYEFWILAPGGGWKIVQSYSTSATFSWNTSGLPAGTYYFSIWVRDTSSASGYDAFFPGAAYSVS